MHGIRAAQPRPCCGDQKGRTRGVGPGGRSATSGGVVDGSRRIGRFPSDVAGVGRLPEFCSRPFEADYQARPGGCSRPAERSRWGDQPDRGWITRGKHTGGAVAADLTPQSDATASPSCPGQSCGWRARLVCPAQVSAFLGWPGLVQVAGCAADCQYRAGESESAGGCRGGRGRGCAELRVAG